MLHSIHTTVSDPRLPSEPLPAPAMTDSSTQTDLFTVLQKQRLKLRKPREASEKKNKKKTKENPSHPFSKSTLNCFLSSVYDTRTGGEKKLDYDNQTKFLYFLNLWNWKLSGFSIFLVAVGKGEKKWSWQTFYLFDETFFFCSSVVNTGEKTIWVRPWNRSPDVFSLTCQGFRMKRMILDVMWQCSWAMLTRQKLMERRWCLLGTHVCKKMQYDVGGLSEMS